MINLTIADDEVVRRIGSRRCCTNEEGCGVCYNLAFRPPKKDGVCDRCGSPLELRDDDKEDTVRRRLVEFHKNTAARVKSRLSALLKKTFNPEKAAAQPAG